jgi:anti-anti-sigma factor
MNDPLAHIVVAEHHDQPLLRVIGEIDMTNATSIGEQLSAHTDNVPVIVVDLTDLEFIDSQGLNMLHNLSTELRNKHTAVIIVAPPSGIAGSLLHLVGMDHILDVRPALPD